MKDRWYQNTYPYLVFFIFFQLYLKTMCPTVYWEDSPEFITAAHGLGLTHPTGYPLYCLTGKLLSLLFLGDLAYRVNLVSAISAAAAVTVFYMLVCALFHILRPASGTCSLNPGVMLATFAAGTLSPCWSEGVVAEVYALNLFFFILILYLVLSILADRLETRLLFLFPFVYGLSLSNHMTMGLYLPVFVVFFIYIMHKKRFRIARWSMPVFMGFLGLCPYFYVVLRAQADPMKNWFSLDRGSNFLEHLLAAHYASFYSVNEQFLAEKTRILLSYFSGNFSILIGILCIPGLIFLYRKWTRGFLLFAILFITNFLFLVYYLYETFFLPSFFIICILSGTGLFYIEQRFTGKSQQTVLGRILRMAMYLFVLVIITNRFLNNYQVNDKHDHYWAQTYCSELLNEMKLNGVELSVSDQNFYLTEYAAYCLRYREDIRLIHRPAVTWPGHLEYRRQLYPDLVIPGNDRITSIGIYLKTKENLHGYTLQNKIRETVILSLATENMSRAAVYWEGGQDNNLLQDILIPHGLQFRVTTDADSQMAKFPPEFFRTPLLRGDVPAMDAISRVYYNYGVHFLRENDLVKAKDFFRTAKKIYHELPMPPRLETLISGDN